MEINTQLLQEKCKKILDAIGTKKGLVVDKVELKLTGGTVFLSITDREYYLSVPVVDVENIDEDFRVVVEADKFLKLVNKTTTKNIQLSVADNVLYVKNNGSYKLPLIADNTGKVVELPKITINNVTNSFTIKNAILQSVLKYNEKIFSLAGAKGQFPFLYIDNTGAITYDNCACINSFTLEQPVSLFLTEKLVKLFKLFKSEDVNFTLGFDELPNGVMQQKVCFDDGDVVLYAILTTDSKVVDSFPAKSLRDIANSVSPHTVVISKEDLVGALDRISLFRGALDSKFAYAVRTTFGQDGVKIEDYGQNNSEVVFYEESCPTLEDGKEYSTIFNIDVITMILNNCEDEFLTVSFGAKALYISKANIVNIIPEYRRGS